MDFLCELPINKYREEIVQAVKQNQFVVVLGGTGCGKSTQIPQYLYNEDLHENETIGITEPRRIAAVSMAERVALEMRVPLGTTVGYEIRFDRKGGICSKIKYMTDGILLNESIRDRQLNNYRIIMIDEAHDRSLNTDLLMALLKIVARRRPELKVIISSATIDAEKFARYFDDAKVVRVESVVHPVKIMYYDGASDYIAKTVELVTEIHGRKKEHEGTCDILVFLTGEEDIFICCEKLGKIRNVVPIPLCSVIDFESQHQIFEPVRQNETKVIVATNIAETSLTIEGITHVIDCGYVKHNYYNYQRKIEELKDSRISKAQANQRTGRTGRMKPGVCHRLYSEATYVNFKEYAEPEIMRKNLLEISLKLIALRFIDIDFLDCPDKERIRQSNEELKDLGMIDSLYRLTSLGLEVVRLPLDPMLAMVLAISKRYDCVIDVLRIVAMFSEKLKNIFRKPFMDMKKPVQENNRFRDLGGDHFTMLRIYNEWSIQTDQTKWCMDNFIDSVTMDMVDSTSRQIRNILERSGWKFNDGDTEALCRNNIIDRRGLKINDSDTETFLKDNIKERSRWKYENDDTEDLSKYNINGRSGSKVRDSETETLSKDNMIGRSGNQISDNETETFDRDNIQRCFVLCYYRNICIHQRKDAYKRVVDDEILYLSGGSGSNDGKPKIILYHEAMKAKHLSANGVMILDESFLRNNFPLELKLINFPDDVNARESL